jgi:hypothetical protein
MKSIARNPTNKTLSKKSPIRVLSSRVTSVTTKVGNTVIGVRNLETEANQFTARSCRALAALLEMSDPLPGPVIRCIDALVEELLKRKQGIVAYYSEKPGSAE